MEELRLLIEMVSHLPAMAMWVLVGFFAYKVIVIGSLYGVIRFGIDKLHSWAIKPRHEIVTTDIRGELYGKVITIDNTLPLLLKQIERLIGRGVDIHGGYIHTASVKWLERAIDDKIAKDEQAKKAA